MAPAVPGQDGRGLPGANPRVDVPQIAAGIDGFLGTRASLGMDVVLVGLFATFPLLAWSVHLVRHRRDYAGHKRLQLAIVAALLAAIVVFEVDIRLLSDWKVRAAPSPFWPRGVLVALGCIWCSRCRRSSSGRGSFWRRGAASRCRRSPAPIRPVTDAWRGWRRRTSSSPPSPAPSSTGWPSWPADGHRHALRALPVARSRGPRRPAQAPRASGAGSQRQIAIPPR